MRGCFLSSRVKPRQQLWSKAHVLMRGFMVVGVLSDTSGHKHFCPYKLICFQFLCCLYLTHRGWFLIVCLSVCCRVLLLLLLTWNVPLGILGDLKGRKYAAEESNNLPSLASALRSDTLFCLLYAVVLTWRGVRLHSQFLLFITFADFLCGAERTHMRQHTSGGRRITFGGQFSSTTV